MRAIDLGIETGELKRGRLNKITDVAGVRVGHATITEGRHNTGVTVVMPCADNPFTRKLTCASYVLNGFGKTLGLVQVDELGTLETPIALTNTLNVGLVHDAIIEYTLSRCAEEGEYPTSINPVVCECNDASLNDIRARAVNQAHVFKAIESAREDFIEGDVGCGKGTTCHGLKGGVGSASRVFDLGGREYTLGALMQTNHGRLSDLTIAGKRVGGELTKLVSAGALDMGSCICVIATDLPLTSRQLRRVIKRAGVGLARVGSYWGHGSGDVFIGFTTQNRRPARGEDILEIKSVREDALDTAFRAAAEATEEAVINSMLAAKRTLGHTGIVRESLAQMLDKLKETHI